MRVTIGWVILGTLLAFTVLGAVSAQEIPEVVSWVVAAVALAAGAGRVDRVGRYGGAASGKRPTARGRETDVVGRGRRGHPPEHHGRRLH